ncbi:MAG: inositol monophosphatase family protein [bacterium]|nr:inositol monophosphatase family protein [bacterium]
MNILDYAVKTAKKAGTFILKEQKKSLKVTKKGIRDLVTNADKASEKLIIKEILSAYPDHGIIAEESHSAKDLAKIAQAPYIWIIDPIDGTTNFANGMDQYAVSIGIFKTKSSKSSKNFEYLEGELIAGVVYAPALKQLYTAQKGKGAYLNSKRIKVSKTKKVIDAVYATGFPYKNKQTNMPYFAAILEKCRGVRRWGAASLDLCSVARGHFDAHWELGLQAWDIAAGALIVKEAGGQVTDINGNQLDLFGQDLFASNSNIHKETVQIFKTL